MKKFVSVLSIVLLFGVAGSVAADVHVDLSAQFDVEAFVQNGAGAGAALVGEAGWLDAATLPAAYADGQAFETEAGVSFLFGNLTSTAADAFRVNGQTLAVPAGQYAELALALLPIGSFFDLSRTIQLNYADGTSEEVLFGPFASWYDSPIRYADRYTQWTDTTLRQDFYNLTPQQNDEEYIIDYVGTSPVEPRDNYRFVDGNDSLSYEFFLDESVTEAKLGIDMLNNFVVEISTDFGGTFETVLNSQEIFEKDVRDGTNHQVYVVELAPYLAQSPDNSFWVRFTDGSKENGWGPAIYNVSVYQGETPVYELDSLSQVDTSAATVYADFRTNGSEAEAAYLLKNEGTVLSGNQHRYADNGNAMTYAFDLPNTATDAKATINMEANFVVSVAKDYSLKTELEFVPGADRDADYLWENTAQDAGSYRFVDGGSRLMYILELRDDIADAQLNLLLENNFVVSIGKEEWELDMVLNSFDMYGEDVHNASNRKTYTVDLTPYLQDNPRKEIFVLFEDGSTNDGWGPAIRNLSVTSGSVPEFTPVFSVADTMADAVVPYNGTNTRNKKFYTIDLSEYLQDNPEKTLYLKFTDGSTDNGWGPGLFRIMMHSGTVVPKVETLALAGIVLTEGMREDGYPWGVNITNKAFPVNAAKTLESITLPEIRDNWDIYLFAATLEGDSTDVPEWTLF